MTKTGFYKYAVVKNRALEYQVLAIPYKEKMQHDFKRYMVYLMAVRFFGPKAENAIFGPKKRGLENKVKRKKNCKNQ